MSQSPTARAVIWNPNWYLGDYPVWLEHWKCEWDKECLSWSGRKTETAPYRGSQVAVFHCKGGSKCLITNKMSINVKANQATAKPRGNDKFSNKTLQWVKTNYSVHAVKANGKACTKHYNWPHSLLIQRSICFCSSHVSQVFSIHLTVLNRGPGGKETPPACWGSSFSENKRRLHTGTARPACTQKQSARAARGQEVAFIETALLVWQSMNSTSMKLMDCWQSFMSKLKNLLM